MLSLAKDKGQKYVQNEKQRENSQVSSSPRRIRQLFQLDLQSHPMHLKLFMVLYLINTSYKLKHINCCKLDHIRYSVDFLVFFCLVLQVEVEVGLLEL